MVDDYLFDVLALYEGFESQRNVLDALNELYGATNQFIEDIDEEHLIDGLKPEMLRYVSVINHNLLENLQRYNRQVSKEHSIGITPRVIRDVNDINYDDLIHLGELRVNERLYLTDDSDIMGRLLRGKHGRAYFNERISDQESISQWIDRYGLTDKYDSYTGVEVLRQRELVSIESLREKVFYNGDYYRLVEYDRRYKRLLRKSSEVVAYSFDGTVFEFTSWKSLLLDVIMDLYQRDIENAYDISKYDFMPSVLTMVGEDIDYSKLDQQQVYKLPDDTFMIYVDSNVEGIVQTIHGLITHLNYGREEKDLIELKYIYE